MSAAVSYAPLPMALFRGPENDRVAASLSWQALFEGRLPAKLRERLVDSHRTREQTELRVELSNHGRVRVCRIVVSPLPSSEVLATCFDITELEHARDEAMRANMMKDQLLMAVSHDLRAPLSTILLWERILRERVEDAQVREQALDAIRESTKAQSDLIGDLVDVFRVISGAVALEPVSVSLDSLLAAAIEEELDAARAKGVELEPAYVAPLGHVRADQRRLRHALRKVIETAVKVTPGGQTLNISAARVRDTHTVSINQNDARRTPAAPPSVAAMQMQLLVASELLTLHGGALDVISPRDGGATVFEISLPAARAASSRA